MAVIDSCRLYKISHISLDNIAKRRFYSIVHLERFVRLDVNSGSCRSERNVNADNDEARPTYLTVSIVLILEHPVEKRCGCWPHHMDRWFGLGLIALILQVLSRRLADGCSLSGAN